MTITRVGLPLVLLIGLVLLGCPAEDDDDAADDDVADDDATDDDDTGDDDTVDDDDDTVDDDDDADDDDDTGDDDDSADDDDSGDDDTTEVDSDGDGYTPADGDCDDGDAAISPDATEVQDALDNDCDGMADEGFIAAGDLVISEIFMNAQGDDTDTEWFEVTSLAAVDINLQGFVLADGATDAHTVASPVVVGPGQIVVLAANDDPAANGGVTAGYGWGSGFSLANAEDEVKLSLDGLLVDEMAYVLGADYLDFEGVSLNLDAAHIDPADNDDDANWCAATMSFGDGLGSPGSVNETCIADPDGDGDGWTVGGGDCDDADGTVYPGAHELADGLDNDCNGLIDDLGDDLDGDGFFSNGGDCDDGDAAIFPGAVEIRDAIDQNCDGLADEGLIGAGEILITEIYADPTGIDDDLEWFEILHTGALPIDLQGWVLADRDGDLHTIDVVGGWLVQPGSYAVLGSNDDPAFNGGVTVDYVVDSFFLGNADDEVVLSLDGDEIDAVEYDGGVDFPDPEGASINLDPLFYDATGNDDGSNWCESQIQIFTGGYGTPGTLNESC